MSVCPVHGAFPSQMMQIEGAINLSISDSTESCPRCGLPSRVMEGRFNIIDGLVTVLSAPRWTVDALRDVQLDVERLERAAKNESISAETIDKLADRVVEKLTAGDASLAKSIAAEIRGKPRNRVVAWGDNLLRVVGALVLLRDAGGYTVEAVEQIVKQYFTP